MPTFGSVVVPVRSAVPMEINSPDGFMTEPPGDLWWIGMHAWWEQAIPSSVTKAESVLINPLVRMPWIVVDPNGERRRPEDPDYPAWLTDPMLLNGSSGGRYTGEQWMLDRLDRFDFWARWIKDAMRHGWGVLSYRPQQGGTQPVAGTLMPHSPLSLYRSREGWAIDWLGEGIHAVRGDGTVAGLDDTRRIVILRHSLPGGIFGRHRAELTLANRTRSYASESLDSYVPSGVLTTEQPINQTQADRARTEWESMMTRRRIAVIGNGARYQQVVMSPVEAEIIALTQASDKQIAHMYELSAWEVDAPSGDSMTYANIGEKRQDRVDGPLSSWSARIEETLGALFGWGWRISIDFTEYTRQTERSSDGTSAAA